MMRPNILKVSLPVLLGAFILSSCLKTVEPPPPSPPQTFLSVLYLAPAGPWVDVYFDAAKVSSNVFAPGDVTPVYNSVDKGTFAVKFKKGGSDSLVAEVPTLQYDSLDYYSIVLYSMQPNGAIQAFRITDDFSNVLGTSNNCFYRFFHTSPDAGPVDIYFNNVKASSNRSNADIVVAETLTKFVEKLPEHVLVEAKKAGTDSVIATLPNVQMQPGSAYTFYLRGQVGGTGASPLALGMLRAAQ